MIQRVLDMVRKEFLQLRRDRRLLPIVIAFPIIQLFIYGYAVSTDITHLQVAVYDQSNTAESRELIRSIDASEYLDTVLYPRSYPRLRLAIDRGEATVGVVIPPNYARRITGGKTAAVQVIVDGSDPNTDTIPLGYLTRITTNLATRILIERIERRCLPNTLRLVVHPRIRIWYNPTLESRNFMIPGVIALVLVTVTINLTSLAIVRERERGTIEQLIVTPIRSTELILGKMLPYVLLGYVQVGTVLAVGVYWFHVPVRGSLLLLLVLSGLFLMTSLGLGLLISTVSRTQQQSSMAASFIIMPNFLLSGFFFPIANMPYAIQLLTYAIPLRYFLVIVRAIFLKGVGIELLWDQVIPLAVLGLIIMAISVARFRKKLE